MQLKKILELDAVITAVLVIALILSLYTGAYTAVIVERNETHLTNAGLSDVYLERKSPSISGMAILGPRQALEIGGEENVTAQGIW